MSNLVFTVGVDTKNATQQVNAFFSSFNQAAQETDRKLKESFEKPVKKELELVFKNGQFVTQQVERVGDEVDKVKLATQALNKEWGKTPKEIQIQIDALKLVQKETQKYRSDGKTLTAQWRKISGSINDAEKEMKELTDQSAKAGEKVKNIGEEAKKGDMTGQFLKANLAARALEGAFKLVVDAIKSIVTTAFEMETLEIQLQAFTGGVEQAETALMEFSEIAAGTPFDLSQVANAGKIMMAFGVDTETATEATRNLAVVATATGGDLNNLSRNLGQIAAQGQAYTRDLTQFAIQGIPIWSEMEQVTGKNVNELKKLATEGKISFEIVNTALANLAAEGGQYAQIVEEYNNTMTGQLSRLKTNVQNFALGMINAAKDIAEAFGGDLYAPMKAINNELEYWGKELPKIAKDLPGAFADFITDLEKIEELFVIITGAAVLAFGPQIVTFLTAAATAVGKYIFQIKAVIVALGAQIKAQVIALATMGPKGWVILAGAAAVATGAVIAAGKGLKGMRDAAKTAAAALKETAQETEDVDKKTEEVKETIDDAFDEGTVDKFKKSLEKVGGNIKKQKALYKAQKQAVDDAKEAIKRKTDAAVKGLQEEKTEIKRNLDAELDRLDQVKEKIEAKKETALAAIAAERKAAENAYQKRINQLDGEKAAIQANMAATDAFYDNAVKRVNNLSDRAINRLNARKDAINRAAQASLANIANLKQKEKERYDAVRTQLEEQEQAARSAYETEVAAIDNLITKEKERTTALLNGLEEQKRLLEGRYEGAVAELEELKVKEEALYESAKLALEQQAEAAEQMAEKRLAALEAEAAAQERFNTETVAAIEARYDEEERLIEQKKTILETQRDRELDDIQRIIDRIKFRYDEELAKLDELKNEASTRYDDEIAALEQLTPAEERLEEIKREKLIAQAENVELSEEERLSAQAQLDDMERQKLIAEVRIRQREEEAEFEKKKSDLLEEQAEAIAYQEELLEDRLKFYEDEISALEDLGEAALAVKEAQVEAENTRFENRIASIEAEQEAVASSLENELTAIEANGTATDLLYERKFKNIEAEQEALAKTYQDNLTAIEETKRAATEKSDQVVLDLEREKAAADAVYEGVKAEIEATKEAEAAKHEAIMTDLDARAERVRAAAEARLAQIDKQIEKEREQAEKKAERLRNFQTQYRLAQEARLAAIEAEKKEEEEKFKATEDALKNEEEVIKNKYDAEADQVKILADFKKEQAKQAIQRIDDEIKRVKERGKAETQNIDDLWTAYKRFYEKQIEALKDKEKVLKDVSRESDEGGKAIGRQVEQTNKLSTSSFNAAQNLALQAQAQERLNRAIAGSQNGGGGLPGANLASGGPAKGGTTYTVNEVGQEAFLSASGKLSMINAPAWGQWKAPSNGTVIPAHLTTKLDIPTGGINLKNINSSPSGMVSSAVSSVSRVVSGDNINNTVTIQTSKPRQTASDVMVQLAKLKRVRYS